MFTGGKDNIRSPLRQYELMMRFAGEPVSVQVDSELDQALDAVPATAAVFLIWLTRGEPYLGRTTALQRRLKRLFRHADSLEKRQSFRSAATHIEYWPVFSTLQTSLVLYELAERLLPERYLQFLKLRLPYFVKLGLSNAYPRIGVTPRITAAPAQFYGPFQNRGTAEMFQHELLDLFQLRRCQEDLQPSPDHPGCIYGEMNMCLRPCQAAVGDAEYRSEVARVSDFLAQNGKGLLRTTEAARTRFSEEMQFEEAARWHKRVEKIESLLRLRDELASDTRKLHGVAVVPGARPAQVNLWFLSSGFWQAPQTLTVGDRIGEATSLDSRLKAEVASLVPVGGSAKQQSEHLAILARWYHATWRDGKWVSFDSFDAVPYRRVVNAISQCMKAEV